MSDEINKGRGQVSPATVKTKVAMGVKVLRASGEVEDMGVQHQQTVEIDYDMAVRMFGQEKADELFSERESDGDD